MKARLILPFALLCGAVWAAPPLTTIQDMLYKADGTPLNGSVQIQWKSFEAMDLSQIATQSLTVPIVGGVLRVKLVPTTTASAGARYAVRYNSDGKFQFEETWTVPPSSVALRVRDVRVVTGSSTLPPEPDTVIQESDVVGLVTDLAARPVKGAGYTASRAVYAGPTGALEAVVGNLSDCVRVDGTAGPCGQSAPSFVDSATPAGLINGTNAVFTLADAPNPSSSLSLYRNGLLQTQGVDYTLSSNVITFEPASVPQAGDVLAASYRIPDVGSMMLMSFGLLAAPARSTLALGTVSDANIAKIAGIRESKLALNHPTHANINDPAVNEKAALAGTSGAPSALNRYVTDQDPRLSDTRVPDAHALLGEGHRDTAGDGPTRGDLIAAQGTAPTRWKRLPLGSANRCLVSNGSDAVWNACLYTGFAEGAIPFVDGSGNLAQNSMRLHWDNARRGLSVGNNSGEATLHVHDAQPATGSTTLAVRAGQGQGSAPLQRWLDANGGELARVEADGSVRAEGFRGQNHTLAQVLCSGVGSATNSVSAARLGNCTLPAGLLRPGDRVEIRFDYSHEGTAAAFALEVRWGGSTVASVTAASQETLMTGRVEAGVHSSGVQWSGLWWGSATGLAAAAGNASDSPAAPLAIEFQGRLTGVAADTVTLRNFSVIRYPAQQNQ